MKLAACRQGTPSDARLLGEMVGRAMRQRARQDPSRVPESE